MQKKLYLPTGYKLLKRRNKLVYIKVVYISTEDRAACGNQQSPYTHINICGLPALYVCMGVCVCFKARE